MISFTNISGAEEIGANCYLLEMDGTRIVLDSGMHPKKEGKAAMPDFDSLEPNSVEAVFLSHSHLDHLGTLPVLQEKQPAAEVFMTPAAAALSEVMLHNSVNVMSAKRLDLGIVEYPFFTHNDLDRLSDAWHAKSCNEVFRVGFRQNVLATFYDAGHILGSAGVMLEGESRHQDAMIRTEVSVQALKDGGIPLERVDGGIANWDRNQAAALTEGYFERYPDLELILCNNDDMALGAADAVERLSMDFHNIVGIDGTPQGLEAVREERLLGTVVMDYAAHGETIFRLARALALNETPEEAAEIKDQTVLIPMHMQKSW